MAHRPSGGSSPSKSRLSRDADATPTTRISPSPKLLTLGGGGRSPSASASPIGTELPAIDVPFRGSASPRPRKPPHATHFPVVRRAERDASARTPSTSSSQGPMSLGLHGRRVSAGTAAKETSGIPHEILARGDRAQRKFREALAKGKAQPRRDPHVRAGSRRKKRQDRLACMPQALHGPVSDPKALGSEAAEVKGTVSRRVLSCGELRCIVEPWICVWMDLMIWASIASAPRVAGP
ncbi:unnamed protein product [Symbiodinium sp. CCMP2456]|nr:unnamed protein product [Symbiodinium sp. CCMP2456]